MLFKRFLLTCLFFFFAMQQNTSATHSSSNNPDRHLHLKKNPNLQEQHDESDEESDSEEQEESDPEEQPATQHQVEGTPNNIGRDIFTLLAIYSSYLRIHNLPVNPVTQASLNLIGLGALLSISDFNINQQAPESYKTPLHIAITNHASLALVRDLIQRGANVNAKNIDGQTPIHLAIDCLVDIDVLNTLLAPSNTTGNNPSIPVVNEQDNFGFTALHYTALHYTLSQAAMQHLNYVDVANIIKPYIKALIDAGADKSIQFSVRHLTAADLARNVGLEELANFIDTYERPAQNNE